MRESLSLYQIETELAELLNVREELIELGEDLAPIETAIAEYVKREIAKVDGIRSYLKHAEMMAAAAKVEAVVQKERAIAWQGRIDRLKEFCRVTMEAMPWAEGKPRRIDGKLGSLTLKTNGGKQEVVVTQESLLPAAFVDVRATIRADVWERIIAHEKWASYFGDVKGERVPHKGRIAEALSQPCSKCKGVGAPWNNSSSVPCDTCDGDKLNRVPGAHFASRGNHVEIR